MEDFLKVTISKPKSWVRVLEIEIPQPDVDATYNKKLEEYKKDISLPGFRQGKIPMAMIKSRFGASIFGATVEDIMEKAFESACKENNINPINKGKLSNLKAEQGAPISFTLEFEVEPEVDIKNYTNLGIEASPKKIKDADVEKAVEDILDRSAELKDVDRAAKKGDSVAIEYTKVVIDGIEKKDFKNPTYPIEIGNADIKEFDKGLLGRKAGESVDISLTFPKDFSTEDLAGKDASFSIKINAVKEKIVPELNEEFLKKLGDFTNVDALKEQVKKDLEAKEKDRAKNDAHAKAIEKLIDKNQIDVPDSRIESYIDHMMEELGRYKRPQDAPLVREEVSKKYHDIAVSNLKRYVIIEQVAAKEKIKATQTEVDAQIQSLATYYQQPFEDLKQRLRSNGTTTRIRADIREQKTLDFLIGEYKPEQEKTADPVPA
jgi:trigger factor